ncbi:hypothetical protein FBEOM_11352 [Fusarium beomiforme]|uniref:HTH CENPB-type domain-containing protein n=1 Tax=Fusarium beomiforme TaxID=44412 RepID=A0A9P5A9S8_9HYPO|nr:hypothetical protein FBEOM_11352 [Fusarium beomiforme]
MPPFTEKDMSAALQMAADGVSVNKAAEACGINRSTLQGRIKGSSAPREAQKPRQKLSDLQERHLRDWMLVQADLGCPVTHQQVREFASKIAIRNGFPEGVGKNWLQSFMSRNSDIKTLKGKRLDTDRYNGASTEQIKAFFTLLIMPAIRVHAFPFPFPSIPSKVGLNGRPSILQEAAWMEMEWTACLALGQEIMGSFNPDEIETWEKDPEKPGGEKRKRDVLSGVVNSSFEEDTKEELAIVLKKRCLNKGLPVGAVMWKRTTCSV